MSEKSSSIFKQVLIGVVIAACSGSMGYGVSQATLGKDVALNRAALVQMRGDFTQEQTRTDERIFRLTGMMDKQAEQNTEIIRLARELISLIKLQNQMKQP